MISTTLLNRYQIDSELGQGGIGIVYRGHDLLLDRDIAIKVINTKALGSEGNTRLFQEARVVAHLNHPNIVTVYDAGELDDITFVIMELVDGSSLHDRPPKDLEDLVSIIRFVCAGLEHAHQRGIIHRDLKPENVMISPDGRVRLMDFGLARSVSSRLTSEGTIIGTVFYLAPEQALGQAVDNRTDLYALGVMLYELSTGRLPFSGEDPLTVITQHLHTSPVPPCAINPKIPSLLEALILQLMSKQPEDRPPSATEVMQRLEGIWQQPTPATVEHPEELNLARIVRGRIVGRERELAELVAAWRHVLQGRSDERVLLVSGEPGIGKTRLVRELMTRAAVEKAIVLIGECYAEEGAPYASLAQVIRQVLLQPDGSSKNFLANRILSDLLTLAPDLQARFPEVAPNPKLDPQDEQRRLYDSVLEMMIWLSQSAPILLVIDDAHWADRATLCLLRHLARRSKSLKLPLLMVATYREVELDEARPWHEVLSDLNRERLSVRLKLSRLDKKQTQDMLAILFDEEITPELLEGVYFETEGNPFFVEEVVKTLVDEGKIFYEDGSWHRPSMNEIVIPQSVRIAIQTRLTALPTNVQEMLRMASVLGREFDDLLIRQAVEFNEDTLISTIEIAEKAQLISETESSQPGQVKYTFVHALIHATIYESVSGLRRQRLHRRAATAIEVIRPADYEALVFHYQKGGDLERTLINAMKAGERALAYYANQDAEKYFRMTLELDRSEEEKAFTLFGLGQALFRESRFQESIDIFKQAIPVYQQLRDFDRVARIYACLSEAARKTGDIEAGITFGEEGLALLADQPATAGKVALMRETGNSLTMRGWNDNAITLYNQALKEAEKIGNIEEQAETLIRLSFELYYSNRTDRLEGIQMLQRALELAESSGLLKTAEMAHTYLGEFFDDAGDVNTALEHTEIAMRLSRQMGTAEGELFNLNWMYYYQFILGNSMECEQLLPRGRYLSELCGSYGNACLGFQAVEAYELYGRREMTRALEILHDTYEQARQAHNSNASVVITQVLVEFLIEEGKWDEAEQILTSTLQIVEQEKDTIIYSCLARIYSHQKNLSDAQTKLEKARVLAGPIIKYWDQFYLSFAEASLACTEERWDEAWKHFDIAYELVAQCSRRWYEAQILRNRAEVLLERGEPGDPSRACDLLEKTMVLYEKMHLPAWARLIENRINEVRENLNDR
jgi:tetratricopeptide (TPR) repeat protein/type II secretory pathway predicted ATPase ExeA